MTMWWVTPKVQGGTTPMYPGKRALQYPDRIALVMADSGASLTYAQFEAAANQLAHFYRDIGIQPGDRVAYMMENCLANVVAQGAGERTGLYYTLINFHLTADEAAYIVNDSAARVVVTTRAVLDVARELPARCPHVERWLMVDRPEGLDGFEDLDEVVAQYPTSPVADERLGLALLYSSGTTGKPKGVLRPRLDLDPADPLPIFQLVPKVYHTRADMVFLQPAPLYHSGPQSATAESLRCGGTCVIMPKFDAERFLQLVEQYGVTNSLVVPTMLSRILQLPAEVREKYDVSSLEAIAHGAAPCPPSVKRAMIDWLGPILFEYYGSTEANGSVICDSHEWLAHPGTVGKPLVGELFILGPDGEQLPAGQPGVVWIKGATNFQYLNDPEKTKAAQSADGSMSTNGDIGYLDEDGYLYLTDRVGFTIVSGGVNIYPREVEDVLAAHPAVADVAVIGVPDEDMGEAVKAVVELRPGVPTDGIEAEIIEFCRSRLAKFKCPRSVDVIDAMPRNTNGKLMKTELVKRYRATQPA
ncbi:AMP-binding protein [Mycolicibacterium parafortuitum]|uniref:AMP-binding protein n=1 Tax=Mycolicibacterium parafortuitum TaxID=39692 RepID=UPI001F19A89F|nr:AMP-binding protein [Mycolicibacterium parafortuitum]